MNSLHARAHRQPARGRRERRGIWETMSTRQRLLGGVLGISLIAMLAIVFLPIGSQLGRPVGWFYKAGVFLGIPARFGPRWYEFGLNILLFTVPVFFAALLWPSVKRRSWILLAFGISLWIEMTQFLFLPRSPEIPDVIANTTGAWIGVLLAGVARKAFAGPVEAEDGPPPGVTAAQPRNPSRRDVYEQIRNRGSAHLTAATEELWEIREERT